MRPSIEDVWRPVDYDEAWGPFNARFEFRPDHYEHRQPAIRMPDRCTELNGPRGPVRIALTCRDPTTAPLYVHCSTRPRMPEDQAHPATAGLLIHSDLC
jgi:hypothetical protein